MVFCEWLLGNETAEAKALTAMAKEKGIKTFAGLQACPAWVEVLRKYHCRWQAYKDLIINHHGYGNNTRSSLPSESSAYLLGPTPAQMMTIPFAQRLTGWSLF
jgi:hypothetical protein